MDRRRKLKELWNGSGVVKIILVMIPIMSGSLIAWGSWATVSLTKIPEDYTTKIQCETEASKNQAARERLETRVCSYIDKLEKQRKEDIEIVKEVQEQINKNSKLLERIDERTKRIYDR